MPTDPAASLRFPIAELRQRLTARGAVLHARPVGRGGRYTQASA